MPLALAREGARLERRGGGTGYCAAGRGFRRRSHGGAAAPWGDGRAARRRALLAAGALGGARPAAAQWPGAPFPSRPLRIVVPFAAGGSTDILARLCAQALTERLGQPVVEENVTGAGGTIGASRVVEALPDGYTLPAGTPGPIAINPHLQPRIPYQPLRDLAPVVPVGDSPAVAVVRRDSPLRSLRGLVARAQAEPGRLTFASAGVGSFAHLRAELFRWRAGVAMVRVPYRGTAPAAADLIAGRVDTMFENYPSVQAYLASGEARAPAIAARRRSALLPEVPTAAEEGVRVLLLVRPVRARAHAARGDRDGERRDRRGDPRAGAGTAPRRARGRGGGRHAGGVPRLCRAAHRGDRRGHPRRGHQAGIAGAARHPLSPASPRGRRGRSSGAAPRSAPAAAGHRRRGGW
ncbi:tripartite tricarboxylate transporter substrate-binding protein [Caldovatus aquaticus]|uniref:Tripartite tricarboxylate transporter substrate binding protein n=1 Tax=Caldovatus aquaticus TaxID=2865671 RepID=A0ABS7EXL5_9PROT|nr:hypothetical protein [Caldovatus aquaticus]